MYDWLGLYNCSVIDASTADALFSFKKVNINVCLMKARNKSLSNSNTKNHLQSIKQHNEK